jgi:branched-chain amino acid aminotransferase
VIDSISIRHTTAAKPKLLEQELDFGTCFTDYLFQADWDATAGWGHPRIEPYGPIALDPAAGALQYGQSVFEGIKAFRGVDGRVRLFRPEQHLARLSRSAARLCIPVLNPDRALEWLVELVRLEEAWVPTGAGTALYVRPTIIATEAYLGVRPARSYRYFVILSPVGPYAPGGFHPLKIRVEDTYVRAVSGGVGAAKTGGNYAGSLLSAEEARRHGFDQVLWLDGVERRYLDEVGTMNIMLRIDDEIITPPVSDTILAGVVRDSALTLLRDWGLRVSERPVAIEEVVDAARRGTLHEMWGTGTAAVIAPVGTLGYQGESFAINHGSVGEVTQRLHDALVAVQYGTAPDPRGWMLPL